jgi:hypothetical protein
MKETEPKKDEVTEKFKITCNKKIHKIIDFFGHFTSFSFLYLKQRFEDWTLASVVT